MKSAPKSNLLALLGYLALTIMMTWPLAVRLGDAVPGLDPQLQAWTLGWNAHALRAQPLDVWNAPIFFPYAQTLAYTDNHLVLSLLAAPLLWSGVAPMVVHNLLLLASFVLSGWAVFALARACGCRPLAAFVGGAVCAFGAYRFVHLVHLNLLQTAWLIVALWGAVRMLDARLPPRDGRCAALICGFFVGIQSVTALYYAYLSAAALALLGGLWLLGGIIDRRERNRLAWRRGIARFSLAASVAAALALPLTLPYSSVYGTLAIVRSPAEVANWSAPLQAYMAVPDGNRLYGSIDVFKASGGELALFPGFTALALALAGVIVLLRTGRPLWERGFWPCLAALGFILSLGPQLRLTRGGEPLPIPLPYDMLYRLVPGFGALRVPARWGWLVLLAVAVLSAWGLHGLLTHRRRTASGLAGLALTAVLLEQTVAPVPLQALPATPPVYAWLARQTDIGVVLELPVGATPRGAELDRIMRRQFGQLEHWKQLPVSYSGVIPFGTTDILRRVQGLPDDEVLEYLALAGVDALVVHTAEYEPTALQALRQGLARSDRARFQVEIGTALVYRVSRAAGVTLDGPGDIWVSNNEQMPGVLALALIRRWQAEGRTVFGAGRPRYYRALGDGGVGHVARFGLLAADEDPVPLGYDRSGLRWQAGGLALYAADPSLRALVKLGAPPPGQFHPVAPSTLRLVVGDRTLEAGAARVDWDRPLAAASVALEVASLEPSKLHANGHTLDLNSGRNQVLLPVELGAPLELACPAASCSMLRVRVYEEAVGAPSVWAQDGPVAAAETRFNGSTLQVAGRAAGTEQIVIEARGAAAADDKPVLLFQGVRPAADGSGWSAVVDLLKPSGDWLDEVGSPVDGRYIAYVSQPNSPTPGRPIATFNIRNGTIVDAVPVPLPLNELVP